VNYIQIGPAILKLKILREKMLLKGLSNALKGSSILRSMT
jgi:hypothetical protein